MSQGVKNETTVTFNEVVKIAKDSTHSGFFKGGREKEEGEKDTEFSKK